MKPLDKELINKALALYEGYKSLSDWDGATFLATMQEKVVRTPDYYLDLNAIWNLECKITAIGKKSKYIAELAMLSIENKVWSMVHVKASKKAEILVKVLSLMEESAEDKLTKLDELLAKNNI